jgi:hypothetical protein
LITGREDEAVTTVLDSLRRYLLGDEAAEKLELCVDIFTARALGKSQLNGSAKGTATGGNVARTNCFINEWTQPSPGYEPLLNEAGRDQFTARGIAKYVVRRSRQHARHNKMYSQVSGDIRFLAKRRDAIRRCAQRLYNAERTTPIVGDLIYNAGVKENEFFSLLQLIIDGGEADINRLAKMAAMVVPHLPSGRGPKASAPSIAHELLLGGLFGLTPGPWPAPPRAHAAEYVDALTAATRIEFDNPNYDGRPARRRFARKRLNVMVK